jgi:metallo-beta-lactamase family protein
MNLIHLGGENCVTGSCHLVQAKGLNILVDCGSVQGNDRAVPVEQWPVKPSEIDFVFLTHAHIDHIGRIPEIIRRGFQGEILTSHPTKALIEPMLEDAMTFTDTDEKDRAGIIREIDRLSWGFEYNEPFDLKNGIRFKLGRAGHILGSCFIRIETVNPDFSIIFSGDLGGSGRPILPDPDPPDPCDLLVLESTYGDRLHESPEKRIENLGNVLTQALEDGGKVFIPAFALGRTQELIYEMDRLVTDPVFERFNLLRDSKIPVFLDSPLGLEITSITGRLSSFWDQEARDLLRIGDNPLDFKRLYAVTNYRHHLKILDMPGPAVIIAGSGMCTGGRIVNHLKAGIEDSKNDILFVGYQAEGTPGRDIVRYSQHPGGYVNLDGERFDIRARVYELSGYSAHADQKGLVEWVKRMPEKPARIKLVHGEPGAKKVLAQKLDQSFKCGLL